VKDSFKTLLVFAMAIILSGLILAAGVYKKSRIRSVHSAVVSPLEVAVLGNAELLPTVVEANLPWMEQLEGGELDEIEGEFQEAGLGGALPSREEWATQFHHARDTLLTVCPICEACGKGPEDVGPMNAHHVQSVLIIVTQDLDPALKWSVSNLISLCRKCHLKYGHTVDGHASWSLSNLNVRQDAARAFRDNCPGTSYAQKVKLWRKNLSTLAPEGKKRDKTSSKTLQSP